MIVLSKRLFFIPMALAGALAVSACGLKLDPAQRTTAPESAFEAGLHGGYIALAQAEYDEADYRDSDAFAGRAIAVSQGAAVAPDDLSGRLLSADSADELGAARERLMAAIADGATAKSADSAARAQIMFDCWVQEQEEGFQAGDIERCRSGFMEAMAEVDIALAPPPPPPPDPTPRFYTVFFEFDSAELTDEARGVIDAILSDWASKPDGLRTVGHTDSSGPERYNLGLSQKRADSVAHALEEGGIDVGRITSVGTGESNLLVPTEDGVYEPRNRRVSVSVD